MIHRQKRNIIWSEGLLVNYLRENTEGPVPALSIQVIIFTSYKYLLAIFNYVSTAIVWEMPVFYSMAV